MVYLHRQAGGGARGSLGRKTRGTFIVHLVVDPKEAKGANMLNTMLEALTVSRNSLVVRSLDGKFLSNLATALVSARCAIGILKH